MYTWAEKTKNPALLDGERRQVGEEDKKGIED
jgi:hypothetical protein